jgi:hypothetical protein
MKKSPQHIGGVPGRPDGPLHSGDWVLVGDIWSCWGLHLSSPSPPPMWIGSSPTNLTRSCSIGVPPTLVLQGEMQLTTDLDHCKTTVPEWHGKFVIWNVPALQILRPSCVTGWVSISRMEKVSVAPLWGDSTNTHTTQDLNYGKGMLKLRNPSIQNLIESAPKT